MKILGFLKKIVTKIPGFRRLSGQSMVIAATWYGAAILTMVKYWHWGLALLALPFFLFYLIDRDTLRNKRLCTAVSIAAGSLVLLGMAGGLTSAVLAARAAPAPPPPTVHAAASPSVARSAATAAASATAPAASASELSSSAPAMEAAPSSSTPLPATAPPQEDAAIALADVGDCAYVASANSEVFHDPDCASAKRIKPENLVGFASREDALESGRRPCKKCKP